MKDKNGFTLVELLAVIVILAMLVTIAVPSTLSISNKIKVNMYCSKIDSIETAAKLYGEDRKDSFNETYDGYASKGIKVIELINTGYLKKDQKNAPYVLDPRDNASLDDMDVIVYLKWNRIYVHFVTGDASSICGK